MRMFPATWGGVEGRSVNGAEPGGGAAPGINKATEADGSYCIPFSPAVLPQDGGPAAAPGLHPAEEEPLRGNHRAAPGQPAGGGPGSAGALSPGLQLGGGPARPGPGLSLCVCLWVFLYSVAVSPALSKGFLRNALLPGAGCARRARERG